MTQLLYLTVRELQLASTVCGCNVLLKCWKIAWKVWEFVPHGKRQPGT